MGVGNDCFWRIGQDNAAINILEALDGQYRLRLLNDTCHLEGLARDQEPAGSETMRR
jgi:hypothetical protein